MTPLDDLVTSSLRGALDGIALRQRVAATNIANVQTPGYTASRVSFEDSLRGMVDSGGQTAFAPSVQRSLEPAQLNGNNVNLDEETVSLVQSGLRYQLAIQAMNGRFQLLRTAIGGS